MTTFALMLPHMQGAEWLVLVEAIFLVYVPVSFLCVAGYTAEKLRAGRLLNSGNSPMPLVIPGTAGSLFAICVLALLYLQSPYYMIMVVMGILLMLMENHRTAREQFGLERLPLAKLVTWTLLVCGAVIFIEVPLTHLIEKFMTAVHLPHPEQQSVEMFRAYDKSSQIASFMLQAVVISPMIEEVFFRGFLLTFLKKYTSTWLAIVLSAGVFAFAHVNLGSALQLWFLGLVLGIAYEHTGALLLPIGVHACFNLITALSLLLEKGSG